ncbi:uncharacterized protein LOC128994553 [Macrosteles quadrilineatus]|uniref:uncharacterized protein LOC128994553 n=1 Tax=Macrosteles quadrilineatus TaxID=74068 RepID=UPI0023E12232|nr:uncharacterized protein LOC128994553 [Macrosteles quadrilineatus]
MLSAFFSMKTCGLPAATVLGVVALLVKAVSGLRLSDLQGPSWPNRGDNAQLECKFDTEAAKLYSVKWYKDEFEFYRYMPDSHPSSQVFPVPGVSIDESRSGIDRVMLTDLTFASSGSYRCEVSTEAPNFETIFQNHNMTVLAFPRHTPIIEGMEETYSVHDEVAVNCTAAPSNPTPRVYWYINNLKADDYLVDSPDNPVRYPDNTSTTWATLKFVLQRQHFLGPGKLLSLRCDAEAPHIQTQSTTREARLPGALNEMLAQQKRESGAGASRSEIFVLVFTTILIST